MRGPARQWERRGLRAARDVSEGSGGFLLRPRGLERSGHQGRDSGLPLSCLRPTKAPFLLNPHSSQMAMQGGLKLKTPILSVMLAEKDSQVGRNAGGDGKQSALAPQAGHQL